MRTRSNSPRTGRRKSLKVKKSTRRAKFGKAKRPNQIAATVGRRRVSRRRKKKK